MPLTVRPTPDGRYEVQVGPRRLLACRNPGLDPIPCMVREHLYEFRATILSLAENVHRADIHPPDKARALLKPLCNRHRSHECAARVVALSPIQGTKYATMQEVLSA